jgi:GAF domain-containing protein
MKLSLFKNQPIQETESLQQSETIQTLRERILNNLLIGASIFGLLDYFLVVIRSFDRTPFPAFLVYTAAVIWVLIITLIRKLPYRLRALSVVGLIYLLGITSFLQGGVTTDGAIFTVSFVFMASLLIGPQGAVYSSIIGISSTAIVGYLMSKHIIVPATVFNSDDPSGWINRGAVIVLLVAVTSLSLTTMLRGLQKNLTKARLVAEELEKDQDYLRQHSQDLERRSVQIRTAAEISRSISGVLTPQRLLQEAVDLILNRFNLYYVGIFIVDETGRSAVLQAGTGDAGKAMISEQHKLPIAESSMIGWTISHRQARIALDVGTDAIRFANPHLPDTHSELALPLISGDQVIGALTIQSNLSEAFDEDDIIILQNISDTLAIALANARLFQETQRTLEELRIAQRSYVTKTWSETAQEHEGFEYTAGAEPLAPGSGIESIDIPLTLREQIIGQLHLEGDQEWTLEEQNLIEAIASQAALAMENARLLEESQQTALHERLVTEITGKVWSSPNTNFILQTAIKELARALRTDEATIELKLD